MVYTKAPKAIYFLAHFFVVERKRRNEIVFDIKAVLAHVVLGHIYILMNN
jgi:hypothetical protein